MSIVKHSNVKSRGWACRPAGVVLHDTVGPEGQTAQECADQLVRGVTQWDGKFLPPPIYHFVVGEDGDGFRLAENHVKANHVGQCDRHALRRLRDGEAPRMPAYKTGRNGNKWTLGVAFVRTGRRSIPAAQMVTTVKLLASLCRDHRWHTNRVVGHWELTRRKIDPSLEGSPLNMDEVRSLVRSELDGVRWVWGQVETDQRVTLRLGYEGNHLVDARQRLRDVGLLGRVSGVFDVEMLRAVQMYQRCHWLTADGIIGPKTWAALMESR